MDELSSPRRGGGRGEGSLIDRAARLKNTAALLATLLLTACGPERPYTGYPSTETRTVAPDGSTRVIVHTDLRIWGHRDTEVLMAREEVSGAEARVFLSNRTRLSFSPSHETQVSYAASDGRIFLLYPGNTTVLEGRWEVRERVIEYQRAGQVLRSLRTADVCFRYGSNTHNPATGNQGGDWECMPLSILRSVNLEAQPGDVLGLSRSPTPPFILGRERTTLTALAARSVRR